VPVVVPAGWNGAASISACWLGVLAGKNVLLSVLTELATEGSSAIHKAAAISHPAITT
jgi:hypothetical protein